MSQLRAAVAAWLAAPRSGSPLRGPGSRQSRGDWFLADWLPPHLPGLLLALGVLLGSLVRWLLSLA